MSSHAPPGWNSQSGWFTCLSQCSVLLCCVFQAVLAVIIVVNLQGILAQIKDVCVLWKSDRLDLVGDTHTHTYAHTSWHKTGYDQYQPPSDPFFQLVWIASLMFTLIFNLDLGLAVAVAFSLLTLLYRTQQSVNIICESHALLYTAGRWTISSDITQIHMYSSVIHPSTTLIWRCFLILQMCTRPAVAW